MPLYADVYCKLQYTVASLSPVFNWRFRASVTVSFALQHTRTSKLIWEEVFSLIKLGHLCQSKLAEKLPFCRRLQMSSFIWYYLAGRLHWAARWRAGQGRGSPVRWRTWESQYTKRKHHHDHPLTLPPNTLLFQWPLLIADSFHY